MLGISFSGGLSIMAAGRLGLRDRVAYVFSFGDHADLPRVLRYLCTSVEEQPADHLRVLTKRKEGRYVPPPHDYGVVVILLGMVDQLVPPAQVEPLRGAVLRFLWASYLDRADKPQAEREFAVVRAVARTLPEPSSTPPRLRQQPRCRAPWRAAAPPPQLLRRACLVGIAIAETVGPAVPPSRDRRQRDSGS